MKYRILSLLLAILSTFIIGYHLPPLLDQFNDAAFSSATILDQPDLMEALREVQSKGLLMGIHGWRHENYSRITTSQAREAVENSRSVFLEAGLVPVAFAGRWSEFLHRRAEQDFVDVDVPGLAHREQHAAREAVGGDGVVPVVVGDGLVHPRRADRCRKLGVHRAR